MFRSKLTKIDVDFDALPEGKTITVRRSQAQKVLSVQQRVMLYDLSHSRQAEGTVQQLDGNVAVIDIDWDTWSTSEEKDLGDKIGLVIALICILMIAVATTLLIHNLWIGILIAVVALVIVLMHQ